MRNNNRCDYFQMWRKWVILIDSIYDGSIYIIFYMIVCIPTLWYASSIKVWRIFSFNQLQQQRSNEIFRGLLHDFIGKWRRALLFSWIFKSGFLVWLALRQDLAKQKTIIKCNSLRHALCCRKCFYSLIWILIILLSFTVCVWMDVRCILKENCNMDEITF